nr:hypothetical protein BaRGS_013627 [Batillaria attramentaria]
MRQTRLSTGREAGSQGTRSSTAEPSLKDVVEQLASMEARLNNKMTTLDSNMDERLTSLSAEMGRAYAKVQEEVQELREEVSGLRRENQELRDKLSDMELKTDDLECRSRRNNVLFYGLKKGDDEQGAEGCERTVKNFLRDKLGFTEDVIFDRVHRTSSKPNAPIVARCAFYKDRVQILKTKSKLRGSDIFLGEDFSSRVRDMRKKLLPHLKLARDEGKRATMIYDHLLIDNKKFVLSDDGTGIVEVAQRSME